MENPMLCKGLAIPKYIGDGLRDICLPHEAIIINIRAEYGSPRIHCDCQVQI
jgi:hypothetical protein